MRAALALRRLDPGDAALDRLTFGEWLAAKGQDSATVSAFWDLIVLPTVNVPAAEASLKLAAMVFRTGLLSHSDAADIGWATVPLSVLHGEAARRTLETAGGEVRTGAAVRGVRSGAAGRPVVDIEGGHLEADAVVVAVPHDAAAELLPPGTVAGQDRLGELGTSPIVNVHLVYDRAVTELPMAAAVGSDVEFVFDHTAAGGLDDGRQCLTISLSAARRHIGRRSADLVEHFSAEMARLLPAAAGARITESMVTRERAATFVGAPGSHALRATGRTALPGVFLAGAWCDTGWPATMEGAVRSGLQAAELAASSPRRPRAPPSRRWRHEPADAGGSGTGRRTGSPGARRGRDRLPGELAVPVRYHFGWTDAQGAALPGPSGGKGVRGALAVLSAEAAGAAPRWPSRARWGWS